MACSDVAAAFQFLSLMICAPVPDRWKRPYLQGKQVNAHGIHRFVFLRSQRVPALTLMPLALAKLNKVSCCICVWLSPRPAVIVDQGVFIARLCVNAAAFSSCHCANSVVANASLNINWIDFRARLFVNQDIIQFQSECQPMCKLRCF